MVEDEDKVPPSFENEKILWRQKLRESQYLTNPNLNIEHKGMTGNTLSKSLVNIIKIGQENQELYTISFERSEEIKLQLVSITEAEEAAVSSKLLKPQLIKEINHLLNQLNPIARTFYDGIFKEDIKRRTEKLEHFRDVLLEQISQEDVESDE